MKRTLAALALLGCLTLTACGESVEDVKRDAEFAKICKDSGGHILYDGFDVMHCSFEAGK